MAKTYSEKLKDPRWQKKRLEVLERDGWSCRQCADTESTLAVHHLAYRKGKDPWEYDNEMLLTLCEECHDEEYNTRRENESYLLDTLKTKGFMAQDIFSFFHGFSQMHMPYPPEVMSSVLEWALKNREIMETLADEYLASIQNVRD